MTFFRISPSRLTAALTGLALLSGAVGVGCSAFAAAPGVDPPATGLVPVRAFGANPGALSMYTYTPPGLAAARPVVVALHGCTQSASDYYTHSGWPALADRWQFTVVFPQQSGSNNSQRCFNWYTAADTGRGQGESASIKSMVDKATADHRSDSSRVFVTGLSAGGAMAANLLAAYPDVFAAGGINSGLPAQCATALPQATNCMQNDQRLTPAQWAARAKAQHPGYNGPFPRVAIWQGGADYVVYPINGAQLRDQWTAVHGLSQTPTSTQNLPAGTTLTNYADANGTTKVQLYAIAGMGHGAAVDPGAGPTQCGSTGAYFLDYICSSYYTGVFFGLDADAAPVPPTPTRPASPAPTRPAPTPTPTATSEPPAPPPATPVVGACVTASNYAHTQARRAYHTKGRTYANGSNQSMGLWNSFQSTTLRPTGPGYWVVADAPC